MIHYDINTVIKEAEDAYNKMSIGRMPDTLGKCAFLLGILKSRYERMFDDLPDNKKFVLPNKYKDN